MIHNRSAKKYLRRVRGMLPCSRKMKKHIMEQIYDEISLFQEDHPEADYNALISRFGEPESIATSYVEGMGTSEILKKFHIRKRILPAAVAVLLFIILTWVSIITYEVVLREQDDGGHIEVIFEES